MMVKFHFKFVTEAGVERDQEIDGLNLMTEAGEITVLAHHRPLIAVARKGKIKILNQNQAESFELKADSILEVRPDEVKILTIEP